MSHRLPGRSRYHMAVGLCLVLVAVTVALAQDDLARERFGQGILPGVLCRVVLVRGLAELGRFPQALATGEEAVRIAEAVNHPASLLLGWWACGLPSLRRGDVGPAIVALEHATRICHEVELPIFLHWVEPTLGAAYALAGRAGEALTLLERRLEQDTAMHVLSQSMLTTIYLAEAHLHAGNVQAATDHAARALALSHERHEQGYAAWAQRLIGDIFSHRETFDPDAATVAYQEALSLAQALEMRPLAAHCHLGIGRCANRQMTTRRLRTTSAGRRRCIATWRCGGGSIRPLPNWRR